MQKICLSLTKKKAGTEMKKIVLFILLLGSLSLHSQELVDAIVAIINDDIITLSQYREEERSLYEMIKGQLQGEDFSKQYQQAKKTLLESMITNLLILQEAKKAAMDVSEQIQMTIENIKKENNLDSDEQLRIAMEQQGVNFEDFKKQMEETFLRENVIYSEVRSHIVIDDSETVGYYNDHREEFTELPEYRIRVIYLSSDQNDEEEIQAKKTEIDEKLAAGEDLSSLAGEYSEGPEKESQGDLGSFKKGELDKNLEDIVENLEPGGISPWAKVENGWYLIRLEEQTGSRLKAFDEVRKEIENKLYEKQSEKLLSEYMEKLKKRSYIKILIPNPSEYKGLSD